MVCEYWSLDSECKYHIKMHIPVDQRMHKIQVCQPNPNANNANNSDVNLIAIPEVYLDRMRSKYRDYKLYTFFVA